MKNWILFGITVVVEFLLAMLRYTIMDRKTEARFAYQPTVQMEGIEPRDSVWGLNYPMQYQSYQKTADTTFSSLCNTSGSRDLLEDNPEIVIL
ncbi:hypothetical protein [Cyclobacterium jeungdonense]|uniref:Uncharacterized protein n=1 Tax=Cyclobacterium jeungdonense TaxID=708087 RepID=A0ABT8C8P4_9BACT|nr:hypothetical protein [Cyclobacterium jeungdonense]MDN3688742.1 hypothetical protein [Cyclobacterium jeungdonense]